MISARYSVFNLKTKNVKSASMIGTNLWSAVLRFGLTEVSSKVSFALPLL